MPELFFKGKEYVYNHHLTVPCRPLVPDKKKSIGPADLGGNLVIDGDNLHALKSLPPRYAGKVWLAFDLVEQVVARLRKSGHESRARLGKPRALYAHIRVRPQVHPLLRRFTRRLRHERSERGHSLQASKSRRKCGKAPWPPRSHRQIHYQGRKAQAIVSIPRVPSARPKAIWPARARRSQLGRSFTVSLLLSREMPIQILLCKPRPDHGQRENTGHERGEAQRYVVEADVDEGMHVAGYDENPCQ